MATWVVQSNKIRTSQVLQLVDALNRQGEPFVDAAVDQELGLLTPTEGHDLIPYGSTWLTTVAENLRWKHLFFDRNTFRVDAWLANHNAMLNTDSLIVTLSEAKAIAYENESWFIRPLEDLKQFPGHVITSEKLDTWVTTLEDGKCEIDGSCLVALARPKEIQMEWRYFIVDGRIATGSAYLYKNQFHKKRETDRAVLEEAQALADVWLPHPCCCMDVALVDGVPRIVEFNTLNSSGFYDHDIDAFVRTVSAYAKQHG